MSFAASRTAVRFTRGLSAITLGLALGFALAACGGGGEDAAVAPAESSAAAAPAAASILKAAAPVSMMLEGCVLDRFYVPTTGTPVRALAADGRLLGSAQSDDLGRFTLRLPAGSAVTLQIDRPQGESLPVRAGAAGSTRAACLLDDQA